MTQVSCLTTVAPDKGCWETASRHDEIRTDRGPRASGSFLGLWLRNKHRFIGTLRRCAIIGEAFRRPEAGFPVSLLQNSIDSIGETYRDLDKQITRRRKTLEKRTRNQLTGLRKKLPKRVQRLPDETTRWIEKSVNNVLWFLHLASKSDLDRIDRKLEEINQRLHKLRPGKKYSGLAK